MSKVKIPDYNTTVSGNIVSSHQVDMVIGRLLTVVESLGLKDTQEKALKDIVRDVVYGEIYGRDSLWVSREQVARIVEENRSNGTVKNIG